MNGTPPSVTLGTSLFSLTHEHHARKLDLGQQIAAVGQRGLGPGLELVGYQCLRGFPSIDPQFTSWFRSAVDAAGLQPSCLDGEVDLAVRSDRLQTDDEVVSALEAQLTAAHDLGFPVLRVQMLAAPAVLLRCVSLAERLRVAIGIELDSFHGVDTPAVLNARELVEKVQSPWLGFVPDFGASMSRIPAGLLRFLADNGVSAALIGAAQQVWATYRPPEQRMAALMAAEEAHQAPEEHFAMLRVPMTVCGAQDPDAWSEVAGYTVHVHAKFFEFDKIGDEPNIDNVRALGALVRGGYRGSVSSEWGGVMYTDTEPGLDMVARHHALLERLVHELL